MSMKFVLRYVVVPIVSVAIGVFAPVIVENVKIRSELSGTNFAGEVSRFLTTSGSDRDDSSTVDQLTDTFMQNIKTEVERAYGSPLKENYENRIKRAITDVYNSLDNGEYRRELIEIYRTVYNNSTEKIIKLNTLYEDNEELASLVDVAIAVDTLQLEKIDYEALQTELREIFQSICSEKNGYCTVN